MKIRLPVRSAIYKHDTGGLVVRWVTTSESPLLYVFVFAPSFCPQRRALDGVEEIDSHMMSWKSQAGCIFSFWSASSG